MKKICITAGEDGRLESVMLEAQEHGRVFDTDIQRFVKAFRKAQDIGKVNWRRIAELEED